MLSSPPPPPSMMLHSMATRSSMEIMLERIRQSEEQPKDVPPMLPVRPMSRGRLPPARRSLPIHFQKTGFSQHSKEIKAKNEDVFGSIKSKKEVFVESLFKPTPLESETVAANAPTKASVQASTGENESRPSGDDVGFALFKVGIHEGTGEKALQGIVGIQKCFRGHQARCHYREVKSGICALQSFIRGENARKDYMKLLAERMVATVLLQKHMKKYIAGRTLEKRRRAVLCVQAAIRGWLIRKRLGCKENLNKAGIGITSTMNSEKKEHVWLPSSVLVDLQRRVLEAETALEKREEENAALRQQLEQSEKKWSCYEAKMKSMEETWQNQFTSLQANLATARKSLAAEDTKDLRGMGAASPDYNAYNAMPKETPPLDVNKSSDPTHDTGSQQMNGGTNTTNCLIEQHKMMFNDVSLVFEVKSEKLASSANPEIEMRKLKLRFRAWKRDFRIRLRETKAALQKLGQSEKKQKNRWWSR